MVSRDVSLFSFSFFFADTFNYTRGDTSRYRDIPRKATRRPKCVKLRTGTPMKGGEYRRVAWRGVAWRVDEIAEIFRRTFSQAGAGGIDGEESPTRKRRCGSRRRDAER